VVVAITLSFLIFSLFHAMFDPEWLWGYRAALTLDMEPGTHVTLPATLTDNAGNKWLVGAQNVGVIVGPYTNPTRRAMYSWFAELFTGFTIPGHAKV
jgi:hypothetical protein